MSNNALENLSNNFGKFMGSGKNTESNKNYMFSGTKIVFLISAFVVFVLLIYGYKDHFHNPFHFDDDHTICSNQYIRDIKNIPLFFVDATTTSSLPANQAYRPGLTTLNAIDFWIGQKMGGKNNPDPYYFHLDIFFTYIILGFLLFLMFNKIFSISLQHRWTPFFALFATAFYMLHTANVETITYIISRSDSFSTLMIVLAMVIYMYKPMWRKFYLYMIPILIGFFVKEPAIMIAPLLFVFIVLFEDKISLGQLFNGEKTSQGIKTLLKTIPLFILAFFLFAWSMHKTPPTWTSGAGTTLSDRLVYLQTETFVAVHYFNNFFFPFNLSADTDWGLIRNIFDDRIIVGILFIMGLIAIAFIASKQEKTKPITFGILWFFIALVPTSTFFPFAEVLNDHRTFFPYIGLTMATIWSLALLIVKFEKKIVNNSLLSIAIVASAWLVLCAHTIGIRTRVEVWSSGETLWHDVALKSPNNGRGLMNYGNALMGKGDYPGALDYYTRAKALYPYYPYIYVNLGILDAATNKPVEAEDNFKYALRLDGRNPESYYYYANWLRSQNRIDEAKNFAQQGLSVSPNHISLNSLNNLLQQLPSGATKLDAAIIKAKEEPSPEHYIDLSLEFCNVGKYELAIKAAEDALKLKPDYDLAYNNMCYAYDMLKQWDKAIEAGNKGMKINPNNELLKGNLNWAMSERSKK